MGRIPGRPISRACYAWLLIPRTSDPWLTRLRRCRKDPSEQAIQAVDEEAGGAAEEGAAPRRQAGRSSDQEGAHQAATVHQGSDRRAAEGGVADQARGGRLLDRGPRQLGGHRCAHLRDGLRLHQGGPGAVRSKRMSETNTDQEQRLLEDEAADQAAGESRTDLPDPAEVGAPQPEPDQTAADGERETAESPEASVVEP